MMRPKDSSNLIYLDFRRLCTSLSHNCATINSCLSGISSKISEEKRVAISEISGIDSIAATIEACREEEFDVILPTVVRTGTEYGDVSLQNRLVELLRRRVADTSGNNVEILNTVCLSDPEFWSTLNARFTQYIIDRYGIYSPCLGCHLYVHALRIPLALKLDIKYVITGERLLHSTKEKINQFSIPLECHRALFEKWGVKLMSPLRDMSNNETINRIVGLDSVLRQSDQRCLFDNNYRDLSGKVLTDRDMLSRYYAEFGLPVTSALLQGLLDAPNCDIVEVAIEYLATLGDDIKSLQGGKKWSPKLALQVLKKKK